MNIDKSWLSCPCPKCGYEFDFTFLQARLEETIICPCCKADVRLTDADASVEGAKREIDDAMKGLEDSFKGLNQKIRF
jgi:hypothetical protein